MKFTKKTNSILVTGSNGFIGKNLLNHLLSEYDVFAINKTLDKKRKGYHPIKSDISTLTEKLINEKFTGIIHMAAATDVLWCDQHPRECFKINVEGTQRILDLARKNNCRLIYLSTAHVYGRPKTNSISEEHPTNPESIYAASKLTGEILCQAYANSYGLDISILRLFSVYGPFSPDHLVTSRIISQLNDKEIKLGNMMIKRDFIFVDDVISAIKLIFKKSKGFNIYNVGMGKSHSIFEICNLIKEISGKNTPISTKSSLVRKHDIKEIMANNQKIKKIGWTPKTELKRGLKITLDWYATKS